jgi:hypothetical protein
MMRAAIALGALLGLLGCKPEAAQMPSSGAAPAPEPRAAPESKAAPDPAEASSHTEGPGARSIFRTAEI